MICWRGTADEARIIAGGQSLMPALNLRLAAPSCLVDIGGIEALRGIRVLRDGRPGAADDRCAGLATSTSSGPAMSRDWPPLLTRAVKDVAHAAIRNRGTFGGSLSHADPASEFPACVLALDARMHIAGRAEAPEPSQLPISFLGLHETAVARGEILTGVEIDAIGEGWRSGFAELARRSGDYAMVGLALHGRPRPGRTLFDAVAPVFFSVGDRPILAREAARVLTDENIADTDRLRLAQEVLGRDIQPDTTPAVSAAACLHLARVLLGRVAATVTSASDKVARVG